MTFKIALNPTFKARIEVLTANQKGGHDKSTFMAEFKRSTMTELEELQEKKQQEVMLSRLVGWSDLTDGDDKPVLFNDENLAALVEMPEAVSALAQAFWKSVVIAKTKN